MVGRTRASVAPVRMALFIDAAGELAGAAVLAFAGAQLADVFNVDRGYMWLASGIFLAAAIGIAAFLAAGVESPEVVLGLAGSNIAAGLVGWLALLVGWGALDPGGRWALAAAADSFILIGVLELLALPRNSSTEH